MYVSSCRPHHRRHRGPAPYPSGTRGPVWPGRFAVRRSLALGFSSSSSASPTGFRSCHPVEFVEDTLEVAPGLGDSSRLLACARRIFRRAVISVSLYRGQLVGSRRAPSPRLLRVLVAALAASTVPCGAHPVEFFAGLRPQRQRPRREMDAPGCHRAFTSSAAYPCGDRYGRRSHLDPGERAGPVGYPCPDLGRVPERPIAVGCQAFRGDVVAPPRGHSEVSGQSVPLSEGESAPLGRRRKSHLNLGHRQ